MAKKGRSKPAPNDNASTGPSAKEALVKKKGRAKKAKSSPKKPSAKKDKKAIRSALEKEVIVAVEQFCKETAHLATYARDFFNSLRKSDVTLPGKSRKALAASARDLRKAARTLKKLSGTKGR